MKSDPLSDDLRSEYRREDFEKMERGKYANLMAEFSYAAVPALGDGAKTLYILIGPKGSGKTTIGTLVAQRTGITFLRVEPIWLGLEPGEDGWAKVETTIDELFLTHDKLMIESLGAGDGFERLHTSLAQKGTVKLLRVVVDLDTCLNRVKERDNRHHIPVPDDQVVIYNRIAADVAHDWDLEIDNNGAMVEDEVIAAILGI